MNQQTMTSTLPPKAALLLATITITAIDGDLDEREVAIINRLDGIKTSDDWDIAIDMWNEKAVDECIPIVTASLNPRQQRMAMANMVDIAMADGRLDEAENILLRAYAKAFDVSDSDVEKIVDVITMKNNVALFK